MATVDAFRIVAEVLAQELGADAPVQAIDVAPTPRGLRVAVETPEPGRFIGRRGRTADAIRGQLVQRLGLADVIFEVREVRDEEPPLDPPSGVRDPRRPRPGSPTMGEALDPEQGNEVDEMVRRFEEQFRRRAPDSAPGRNRRDVA